MKFINLEKKYELPKKWIHCLWFTILNNIKFLYYFIIIYFIIYIYLIKTKKIPEIWFLIIKKKW